MLYQNLKNPALVTLRYADDVLCICEKKSTNEIFTKLNSFDDRLSFKLEKMENNQLKFLGLLIFIENSKVKFSKKARIQSTQIINMISPL